MCKMQFFHAPGQWFFWHCDAQQTTRNRCAGFIYKIDSRIELKSLYTAHEEWPFVCETQENDKKREKE